jgi:hypothetical protein
VATEGQQCWCQPTGRRGTKKQADSSSIHDHHNRDTFNIARESGGKAKEEQTPAEESSNHSDTQSGGTTSRAFRPTREQTYPGRRQESWL